MKVNYHNKKFRPVNTTENSETSRETHFHYFQEDNIVTATYSGGKILKGHLIGVVDECGVIDMRYHQVNVSGEIMTGVCRSTPQAMDNGKIRLLESWSWTSGNLSSGTSIIEEI